MTCTALADTGLDAPVLVVLAVAAVLLLVGLGLLLRVRRSGGGFATLLLLVVLVGGGTGVALVPAPPAAAAPTDCPDREPGRTTRPGRAAQPTRSTGPGEVTQTTIEPEIEVEVENALAITQTSTMDGLAPGVAPEDITGLVVNEGPDDTFVTAIVVDIVGVVGPDGAPAAGCDASDYVLLDVRMPVGRALAPYGGSTTFAGAAIGFNDKSTNQDACQGATVRLRYQTSA